MAPPKMSQVELTLNRKRRMMLTSEIPIVSGSTREDHPNCHVTAAIKPREAILTPSRREAAHGELRSLGMRGLLMATKMNEGRKMPAVARTAPGRPPRT